MNKAQQEVEQTLKRLAKLHKPGKWKPESYIGAENSEWKFLNLKVPHIRKAQQSGYSFSDDPMRDQWDIWHDIWHKTAYFEVALTAIHFVNRRPIEELHTNRKRLLTWQKRVDNWALSDELSNAYSRLLEYKRSEMLPSFEAWNRSSSPWERRQSMIGLLFYARFRQKKLPCTRILSFVRPHLEDPHYYVQKAVGWTLRECWNVYPEPTLKFLEKNAHKIPPGGWTAATEKLPKTTKSRLKSLRTDNRN